MTAARRSRDLLASSLRAHVLDRNSSRATHVFGPTHLAASRPTRGYTLAGFPSENLRAGGGAPCA